MSSLSKARSRRIVSLRVSYDLQTGTFRMPAFIEIAPNEFIKNPAVEPLQVKARSVAQVAQLRILDGGRATEPARDSLSAALTAYGDAFGSNGGRSNV
jgi:hypothetical protein